MRRRAGSTPSGRLVRLAGLAYVLASSYAVARLATNRLLFGAWGLSAELVAHLIAVTLAQLAAVAALDAVQERRRRRRP